MVSFDDLITLGNKLLKAFETEYGGGDIPSSIATQIKSFQIQGKLLLKNYDRSISQEFSNLFLKDRNDIQRWDYWNNYLKGELERGVGIVAAVSQSLEAAADTSITRVFLSHGKFTPAFTKLESFIRALQCIPIYDAGEPTEGKTINQYVERLMSESDFFVILATFEATNAQGVKLPNNNVMIEYDRLIKSKPDRVLVLLEADVKMPSMVQDVIYRSFSQSCMDEAFIQLARELTHLNLI